jgi:lysylphosphatidylglycerol synthetase-like protein (DUF2156 family)
MQTVRRMLPYCSVALVNILSTLLPVWPMRYELLASWVPRALIQGAQFTTLGVGVTMLVLAAPVAGGHLKSARILMACTSLAMLANILKGLDIEEAFINGILLATLWRGRRRFDSVPLRYTPVDAARLALALLAFLWLYNLAGVTFLRALRSIMDSGTDALPHLDRLIDILTAKLKLEHLWFHESQLILPVFLLVLFLVFSWRAVMPASRLYDGSEDLYARFGRASHNSLAYLAQRADVLRFVDSQAEGAITYRQIGRIAVQIGAILSPPERREPVYRAFLNFCRGRNLIPSAAAITADEREVAQSCGMHTLNIGTEAIVDLSGFRVEHLSKKMRWVQRSLGRRGYSISLHKASTIQRSLQIALYGIDKEWRVARGGRSHGCCMTLGRFPNFNDSECLVAVASNDVGTPVAYLTLLPGGEGYYSLDLTRRAQRAPNAIIEFLLLGVLCELQRQGVTQVSLNFSTLSSLASVRGLKSVMAALDKAIQLGSLEAFNSKFKPSWEPRYLVLPSWYYLPDVAYAILALEGVDQMLANALIRRFRRLPARTPAELDSNPLLQSESA